MHVSNYGGTYLKCPLVITEANYFTDPSRTIYYNMNKNLASQSRISMRGVRGKGEGNQLHLSSLLLYLYDVYLHTVYVRVSVITWREFCG